jgi:dipeptidase E
VPDHGLLDPVSWRESGPIQPCSERLGRTMAERMVCSRVPAREGNGDAMKLLLSSCSIVHSPGLIDALTALLPPRPRPWRIGHIVTASLAGRPATDRSWTAEPWIAEEERQLHRHGFLCDSLAVAGWSGPALAEYLAGFDVLYIQGGNTFYLLDQMRCSGADRMIQERVAAHGTVSCGVSAGSILAGPEISSAGWSPAWDRNEVGLTDLTGLHLVPFVLSPHYVPEDAALIAARLPLPDPLLVLRDGQAWVVDGTDQHLLGRG